MSATTSSPRSRRPAPTAPPSPAAHDEPPAALPPSRGPRARFRDRYVTGVRDAAEAASREHREIVPAAVADRRMVVVLVTAALCLTANRFLASGRDPGWLLGILGAFGAESLATRLDDAVTVSAHADFHRLAFWAVVQVAGYVVLPVLAIRLVLRERVRDFGLRLRGIAGHAPSYLLLLAVSLPGLVWASGTEAFQAKYPFYDIQPGEGFWPYLSAWWALYALQFVALEFFFRGFLVHGLAPRLGYASIFVMMVPYNMIHFSKPPAEALAAIVGGVVLGTLSLKTRSIWWGAALHIAIAGSMDVLSLWHRGLVF